VLSSSDHVAHASRLLQVFPHLMHMVVLVTFGLWFGQNMVL